MFLALVDSIGEQLDVSVAMVEPARADVVYMCGLPTGKALDRWQPLVVPVMAQNRYRQRPVYFSDVLLRSGLVGSTLAELSGRRIAYNEGGSFSGYHMLLVEMARLDIDPASFHWHRTGSHLASLRSVGEGSADLAAIDSMIFDLDGAKPDARVVTSLGPWAAPPISVNRHRRDLAAELTQLMATMHENERGRQILRGYHVTHLVQVDETPYQHLAEVVAGLGPSVRA
jgi:phosphonate transport system substrate-binding protein